MRCRLVVVVLLLLLARGADARPIRVEKSFPQGILYLLESLREEPHHSQHLRKVFLELHPLSTEEEAALAGYRLLLEQEHAQASRRGQGLGLRLELMAVDAGTVDAFLARARERLAPEDSTALDRAVRSFREPYRALVWAPCQEDLDRQLGELRAGFAAVDAPARLDDVANFMGSTWPEDRPLRVLLTPIPKKRGQHIVTYGHSNGALQVSEAPTGAPQQHAGPVLFHEMCHALWNERARPEEVDTWFKSDPLARQQLDEGLATALGNGWFTLLATGKLPQGPWYENAGIDGYARALYPLVQEALDHRSRLDETFARRAMAAFEGAFPEAWRLSALVTARLLLLAEDREDLTLERIQDLGRTVQLRECSAASPLGSPDALKGFRGMAGGTVVFLLPPGKTEALAPYPVDRQVLAARTAPFLWAKWTGDRWLVISVAASPDERRAAVIRFLRQERLVEGFQGPSAGTGPPER